jgi:hypothetical protein
MGRMLDSYVAIAVPAHKLINRKTLQAHSRAVCSVSHIGGAAAESAW